MPQFDHFDGEQSGDVWVIRLNHERLNHNLIIDQLRSEFVTFVEATKPLKVLINCHDVKRMSSEVINAMLRVRQLVQGLGGDVKLCSVEPGVRMALKFLNLDGRVFKIYDSEAEALDAFQS